MNAAAAQNLDPVFQDDLQDIHSNSWRGNCRCWRVETFQTSRTRHVERTGTPQRLSSFSAASRLSDVAVYSLLSHENSREMIWGNYEPYGGVL